jgi:spore coat polysaccharide biosynthesis protein SpsF (cytidylyltransferase family)/predicted dehydrogenase
MKILVVGTGSIGRRHLRNLKSIGISELVVVEPIAERAHAAATEFGALAVETIAAALEQSPQAAVIATPTALHIAQATELARAGCHLFIEKPLGSSIEGVERLMDEVERRRVQAMVGCNFRFDETYARIKKALDERELGGVYAAQLYYGQHLATWRPHDDYRKVYSSQRSEGGGILLDAVHEIDLATWWFGAPRRVLSITRRTGALEGDVEDVADLLVEFRSGVTAAIHLNSRDPGYRRRASVSGDDAVIEADFGERSVTVRRRGAPPEALAFKSTDANSMYVAEMRYFLDLVEGKVAPMSTLGDGLEVMKLALDARDRGPVITMPRTVPPLRTVPIIVQARMGSTRLPGKVLMKAAGKTMLEVLVERLRRAKLAGPIVIATTDAPADRAIIAEAGRLGVLSFAGSEDDVLGRYVGAMRAHGFAAAVRITADCPLMDPEVVDRTIERFLRDRPDYCSNVHPRAVPDGHDVEVFSRAALERAFLEATAKPDREHVTHFLYTHRERFEVVNVGAYDPHLGVRRWTLDTAADLRVITEIIEALLPTMPAFDTDDILALLTSRPELDSRSSAETIASERAEAAGLRA